MDRLTPQHRSWNMSRIRSRDTRPEIAVQVILRSLRYLFRSHPARLPGSPDFCVPSCRVAILVHGCFWHRHRGCKLAYSPKTRKAFWTGKFKGNVRRDRRNALRLRASGWSVFTIWECRLRDPERVRRRLARFLSSRQKSDTLPRSVNCGPTGPPGALDCRKTAAMPSLSLPVRPTLSSRSVASGTRSRRRSQT